MTCDLDHYLDAMSLKVAILLPFATLIMYSTRELKVAAMSVEEKRLFHRVSFDNNATLLVNDEFYTCEIIDLSLKGALIAVVGEFHIPLKQIGRLAFNLSSDDEHRIEMEVEVAHIEDEHIGLHCITIDVDSISHLRKVIELNTGDCRLLERELSALVH